MSADEHIDNFVCINSSFSILVHIHTPYSKHYMLCYYTMPIVISTFTRYRNIWILQKACFWETFLGCVNKYINGIFTSSILSSVFHQQPWLESNWWLFFLEYEDCVEPNLSSMSTFINILSYICLHLMMISGKCNIFCYIRQWSKNCETDQTNFVHLL